MDILNEITHLEPLDVFYVGERHKTRFDYPAHCHEEIELNFVENAAGAVRHIGDNSETIGELDLVLITGSKLVHVWEQGTCPEQDIHEITFHISPDLFRGAYITMRQFASIRRMLERAQQGLAFPTSAIQALREDIINTASNNDSFASAIRLFNLMHRLSLVDKARELSSSSFADSEVSVEDRRIMDIREYIAQNYSHEIELQDLADMACLTTEAFSRFFRHKTGKAPIRYIIDYRLGMAARMLLQTKLSVSEIGYACGFNTQSHFNRLFREAKGCTPSEFREQF